MSRNVWHQCGGGWAEPTLFLAGPFQRGGSAMKVQGLVVLSNLSVFHRWSVQSAALLSLSSDELMSCCAVGTNGCRNLRCHAFPLGGQVSAEWSRCPGSMGQCARDTTTKLSRLDACKDREIVRWCRMQASSHNSQGVIGGRVNKAAVRLWSLQHQTGA